MDCELGHGRTARMTHEETPLAAGRRADAGGRAPAGGGTGGPFLALLLVDRDPPLDFVGWRFLGALPEFGGLGVFHVHATLALEIWWPAAAVAEERRPFMTAH